MRVESVRFWLEGHYKGQPDEALLSTAAQERLTLVTYDQKTILPVLVRWKADGTDHAGVVFIDDRSIANNHFGALVRALTALWDSSHAEDWTNRVEFRRSAR